VDAMSSAAMSESSASDPHVRAVVEFGIAYEQAFVDWIDHLPAASAHS
jgi:hypothetical protein